jgi:MFS family permease
MAWGLGLLALVTQPWHVYAAFVVMSVGWATMSGAAINIIVAPWFDRRRGLAVSWALNGASAGGIIIAPLLTFLIAKFGFAFAIVPVSASMLATLIPVAMVVLRPRRVYEYDPVERAADPDKLPQSSIASAAQSSGFRLTTLLRSGVFISISVPFALGLTAQVGFLTHQIGFLSPTIGTVAAGWAVSLTTFAAVLGRIVTGYVADRFERRPVACVNFIVQMLGMAILATATAPAMLYLGCALFGLGVGNTTSLPGLLVQQEFPKQHFARIVSVVVAINQFSFAFGPSLLGQLEHAEGSYATGLLVCLSMEALAALIVISPAIVQCQKAGRVTGRHCGEATRERGRPFKADGRCRYRFICDIPGFDRDRGRRRRCCSAAFPSEGLAMAANTAAAAGFTASVEIFGEKEAAGARWIARDFTKYAPAEALIKRRCLEADRVKNTRPAATPTRFFLRQPHHASTDIVTP